MADELAGAIDIEASGVAEGFARLHAEGRHAEAIGAYAHYVLGRLRDPEGHGVPSMCVSPEDPDPAKARMDQNLQRSSAEDLMSNLVVFRDTTVDVGPPGAIPWAFIPPGLEEQELPQGVLDSPDDHTGDIPLLPRTRAWRKRPADFARFLRRPCAFNALLGAYCETGDAEYLEKWSAYIDDWCMNQKTDVDTSPYNIMLYLPQEIERFDVLIGNLAYAARTRETFSGDLPAPTLVRLLLRCLPEAAAASIRQMRYFDANWRWLVARRLVCDGLLFADFDLSSDLIREGRRCMELSDVVCLLPDGTDYELTPNYWGAYLEWAALGFQRVAQTTALDWMDEEWLESMRHSAWLRERAILGMLMPNGRWPMTGPQDLRSQLGEYDRAAVREPIPEFLPAPQHAHVLNRVYGQDLRERQRRLFGDGATEPIAYTSESFPYSGFYLLREAWEPDAPLAFMRSSGHVYGHGGPFGLWQNNNAVSLYAFGEELLFLHYETPVTVDGRCRSDAS